MNLYYCIFWIFNKKQTTDFISYYHVKIKTIAPKRLYCATGSLIFVIFFQIALCLWLGCSGVSIIWCAMCGWIMSERRKVQQQHQQQPQPQPQQQVIVDGGAPTNTNNENNVSNIDEDDVIIRQQQQQQQQQNQEENEKEQNMENFVICMNILIICYYAVILPFITTVAHICALVLGAFLSLISMNNKVSLCDNENENNENNENDTVRRGDDSNNQEQQQQQLLTESLLSPSSDNDVDYNTTT